MRSPGREPGDGSLDGWPRALHVRPQISPLGEIDVDVADELAALGAQ